MKSKNIINRPGELTVTEANNVPLIPKFIFYFFVVFLLSIPNLIFSGPNWFDSLHIMKWTYTMVPIALLSIMGGVNLLVFEAHRTSFEIDFFGLIWLLMLSYISLQPLWVEITSWSTYLKEWYFFASLIALYIFCYSLFKEEKYHKLVIWIANIAAAINVLFAELLIRNLNTPFSFIMNVPGNYIGNTGQQEMFGLWVAMAVMNGIYLNTLYSSDKTASRTEKILKYFNLLLLAFNSWGMWNSTTRAGVLSLLTGTVVISIIFYAAKDKDKLKKVAQTVVIVMLVLALNIALAKLGLSRAYYFLNKTMDMFMNPGTFGKRDGIWKTALSMISENPIKGVGIGHFKWHYLKAQSVAMSKFPSMEWQYTYWAHSEYLQWIAEFGLFGGLLLFSMGAWWIASFIKTLTSKKSLSMEAAWAISMVFLLWFDALFSRPFHRIEIIVWLPFAFAIANREILSIKADWSEIKHSQIYRIFAVLLIIIALAGLIFLGGGLIGDKNLKAATKTTNAKLQRLRIEEALRMPMEKDEAQEQLAYHLLAVAKATQRDADWDNAINQLYYSFKIRPKAKQLSELFSLAKQTENIKLLAEILTYLQPASGDLIRDLSLLSGDSFDKKD